MIDFNIDNYLRISLTDVVLVCISTFLPKNSFGKNY